MHLQMDECKLQYMASGSQKNIYDTHGKCYMVLCLHMAAIVNSLIKNIYDTHGKCYMVLCLWLQL